MNAQQPLVVNHDTADLIEACLDAMQRESEFWHVRQLAPEYFSCTDEKRSDVGPVCTAHFSNRGSALSWINHNAMAAAINTYLQRTATPASGIVMGDCSEGLGIITERIADGSIVSSPRFADDLPASALVGAPSPFLGNQRRTPMPEDKDDKDPKPGQDATHSGDPGSSPDAPAPGDAGGPLPPRPEDLPNPAPNPDGGPPIVNPNPATNPGRVGTVSTETAPPLKTEEDSAGSKPPAAEGADAPPANKPGARSPGTKGK